MDWTSPQRRLLREGEFDTPEILNYKIERAKKLAREMEGWDINEMSREQNIYFFREDMVSLGARFWTKDQAEDWARKADGDRATTTKHMDERFMMPCFIGTVYYHYPGYEVPGPDPDDFGIY